MTRPDRAADARSDNSAGTIQFRCWHCRRRFGKPAAKIGERFDCGGCGRPNRVPGRSGGSSRVRSAADWTIEIILCGGGGGLLAFLLALLILSRARVVLHVVGLESGAYFIAILTIAGFLAGALGGVRGLDWIGRKIREREQS